MKTLFERLKILEPFGVTKIDADLQATTRERNDIPGNFIANYSGEFTIQKRGTSPEAYFVTKNQNNSDLRLEFSAVINSLVQGTNPRQVLAYVERAPIEISITEKETEK